MRSTRPFRLLATLALAFTACLAVVAATLYLSRHAISAHIDREYARAVERANEVEVGCGKPWAHRGFTGKARENSIESVQAAFARGACGVEVDILYDRQDRRFYVAHGRPYPLFDGQPLALAALLEATGHLGHFWLDAKDLKKLPPWHARDAVAELVQLVEAHGLRERVLVESAQPVYLGWLAAAGLHTSLLVSPTEHKYPEPVYLANIHAIKWMYYRYGPFSALSMNFSRFTPRTEALLGDEVPLLLSTVNDRALLARLVADPQVEVVLTDRSYYDVSGHD